LFELMTLFRSSIVLIEPEGTLCHRAPSSAVEPSNRKQCCTWSMVVFPDTQLDSVNDATAARLACDVAGRRNGWPRTNP
jgi:hypothetical protein